MPLITTSPFIPTPAWSSYTGGNNGTLQNLVTSIELGSSPVPNLHVDRLNDSRYVVTFDQTSGTFRTGSFLLDKSGTTLTPHAITNISTTETQQTPSAIFLDPSRILYLWEENNTIVGQVWQISGNTIVTPGTKVTVRATAGSDSISGCLIDTDKVFCFYDAPGSNTAEGVVLTISGTAITVNTPTNVVVSAPTDPSNGSRCVAMSSSTVLIRFIAFSRPYAIAASISGTTVSFGTDVLLPDVSNNTGGNAPLSILDGTRAITTYNDNVTFDIYAKVLTVTGTVITLGSEYTVHNDTSFSNFHDIAVIDTDKAFVAYRTPNASNRPRSKVLTISGTTITSELGPVSLDTNPNDGMQVRNSSTGSAVAVWFDNSANIIKGMVVAEG